MTRFSRGWLGRNLICYLVAHVYVLLLIIMVTSVVRPRNATVQNGYCLVRSVRIILVPGLILQFVKHCDNRQISSGCSFKSKFITFFGTSNKIICSRFVILTKYHICDHFRSFIIQRFFPLTVALDCLKLIKSRFVLDLICCCIAHSTRSSSSNLLWWCSARSTDLLDILLW